MQGLLDGLEGDLGVEAEHRADSGCGRGAEVGDVVDLVLVQAHALDQVDLDLVAGGHTVDEVLAADALVLGDREDRRDVVAGVGVFGGEEGVMEVEFADRDAIGPGGPFRGEAFVQRQSEDCGTGGERVGLGLLASVQRGRPAHRGGCDGGVVDDSVDHHFGDVCVDRSRVGRDLCDLPGELIFASQVL